MSGHTGYGRDGRRLPPVDSMTADELHRELVADAVASYTGGGDMANRRRILARQVAAYVRIGALTGHGAEQAINDVLDEVETLTGLRALPVA
jgi:hypothetical protein